MTTALISKSVDIYALGFQLFCKSPLDWNIADQKFVYTWRFEELKAYYFNLLVIQGTLALSIFLIVGNLFLYDDHSTPLWLVFVYIFCYSWGAFSLAFQLILIFQGKEVAGAWTRNAQMEAAMRPHKKTRSTGSKLDILGIFLIYYVSQHILFSLFAGPLAVFFNVDPLYFIFQAYLPLTLQSRTEVQWGLVCIRILVAGWGLFEVIRPIIITFLFSLSGLHLINRSVHLIGKESEVNRFITFYRALSILFIYTRQVIQSVLTVLMFYGTLILVILNFGMIRGYGLVPMPLYLIFPSASLAGYVILGFSFPKLTQLHADTCAQLDKWIKNIAPLAQRRKYLRRKLQSMKPLAVHTGCMGIQLFEVHQSTRNTFYACIMDYTMSLLISVPGEYLETFYYSA